MAFKMKGPMFFKSALKHKVMQFTDDRTGSREKRDHRFEQDGHVHVEGRLVPTKGKKLTYAGKGPGEITKK